MIRRRLRAITVFIPVLLLLAACATVSEQPELDRDQRSTYLLGREVWSVSGRIFVRSNGEGGQGSMQLKVDPSGYLLTLSGPFGQGSWRLRVSAESAVLENSEFGRHQGRSARELLQEHLGWDLPVTEMLDWIRGLDRRQASSTERDERGLPKRLHQDGWEVSYAAWQMGDVVLMPRKIRAQQGESLIKLVLRRWEL